MSYVLCNHRLYLGTRRGANKNILFRPHVRVATGNVFFSWEKHGRPDYMITTAYIQIVCQNNSIIKTSTKHDKNIFNHCIR